MLCKLQDFKNWSLKAALLPILFLNMSLIVWAPTAMAQAQPPSAEQTGGTISGTVLLKKGNRPASQVAVKLKSHVAGIFRSVLTDLEGHFEVRSLPPSTYEIVVDEPGYEPAQASAQLDGSTSPLVLYLNSPNTAQTERNRYTISARELKIADKARDEYGRGLDVDGNSSDGYFMLGLALLKLNRLDEAEKCAREALLRNPNFAEAYLVLSDTYGRRREYHAQLQGLDTYLRLEPNGVESEHVREAREAILRIMAKPSPEN